MVLSVRAIRREGRVQVEVRRAWLVAHAMGFAIGLLAGCALVVGAVLALLWVDGVPL